MSFQEGFFQQNVGKHMETIMSMFGPFMVQMYLNITFNGFIIFSASDWYTKVPIPLFERPETLMFMISWFLNPSPSPKTNMIYVWRHQDT